MGSQSGSDAQRAVRFELVVTTGPHPRAVYPVPAGPALVGSDPACAIRLADASVDPTHAQIEARKDGTLWMRDLTGSGRTLINGAPVREGALEPGSFLRVGDVELCFRATQASGPFGTNVRAGGELPAIRESNPPDPYATPEGARRARTAPARPAGGLAAGTVIGDRYRVIRRVGAGGMGEVYEVQHVELGKRFAVKVMRPELGDDQAFVDRFRREAVAASKIGHRNICDVIDSGRTAEGLFYFAMEYLQGRTLTDVIKQEAPMSSVRAIPITLQMCRALAAAHQQGVVHRDLKPDNVILVDADDETDRVKILDFGVAKVVTDTGSAGQTALGVIIGTPQYMSPEQAAGMPVDHRSDIYALGLILYEMLCGRKVFTAATPSLLMAAHIHQTPAPLEPGPISVPVNRELEALVTRMLAKSPADRPPSMLEILEVLDRVRPRASQPVPALSDAHTMAPRTGRSRPMPTPAPTPARSRAPEAAEAPPLERPAGPVPGRRGTTAAALGVVAVAVAAGGVVLYVAARAPALAPLLELEAGAPVAPDPQPTKAASAEQPSLPTEPASTARTPETDPRRGVEPAAPEPARGAAATTVRITVGSRPASARVFVNDAPAGRTPTQVTWAIGRKVTLRVVLDGHQPKVYTLTPDKDVELTADLVRAVKAKSSAPADVDRQENPYARPEELKTTPY